ncbi:MAG: hypothetical protein IKP77_02840 [Acholeplasmatales bacterium]|nr:hypothetical protein [Acholeplasmatales bacterium]
MEKMSKNKIIFIVITIVSFLMLVGGGILTIISVMMNYANLLYISIPLIGISFISYIVLFIILVIFFKKKE